MTQVLPYCFLDVIIQFGKGDAFRILNVPAGKIFVDERDKMFVLGINILGVSLEHLHNPGAHLRHI